MGGSAPRVADPIKQFADGITTRPFATLTEMADPFGIDPVGRQLHQWNADLFDPPDGPSFAEVLATPGAAQGPPPGPEGVKEEAAQSADTGNLNRVSRRRASRTLFTGGQGVTDSPATASTVLLGA